MIKSDLFVLLRIHISSTLNNHYADHSDINKETALKELDIDQLRYFIENEQHEYSTAHTILCFAIIRRIHRRLLMGYRFGSIKISKNGLIIDGNHRYVAYKIADVPIETILGTSSFCDKNRSFNEVQIDIHQDWDANNCLTRKFCSDDFLKDWKPIKV